MISKSAKKTLQLVHKPVSYVTASKLLLLLLLHY